MNTNRLRVLMLLAFVLTLGAGVVAGLLGARLPAVRAQVDTTTPTTPSTQPADASLAVALGLSNDQREQMRGIWEGVRDVGRDCFDAARKLQAQRDRDLVAMLTPDQKREYDRIQRGYSDQFAALLAQRESAFQKAVERTKQILTEPQRTKYDEILKARLGRDSGHNREMITDTPHL